MTCIVAIKTKNNKVMMGAERLVTCRGHKEEMKKPKIRKRNGIIIAGTGDGHLCSLIVDMFPIPPVIPEDISIFQYMHEIFRPALIEYLILNKYFREDALYIPRHNTADFLIGVSGQVWECLINTSEETDFTIISVDSLNTPTATGSGGAFAKGALDALYSLKKSELDDRTIIKKSIQAAINCSTGSGGKIDIVEED